MPATAPRWTALPPSSAFAFVVGDICDAALVDELVAEHDAVVHFAAESHNDNSLRRPAPFLQHQPHRHLHAARGGPQARHPVPPHLHRRGVRRPRARRPGAVHRDHPVQPVEPVLVDQGRLATCWCAPGCARSACRRRSRNCSNNYGPYQHVEKFIPRQITNVLDGGRPKLYGAGQNVRDWIHVDDHNSAVLHDPGAGARSARPTSSAPTARRTTRTSSR